MVKHHWGVQITTAGSVPLPRTRLIYESSVTGPYRFAGKDRHETTVLFQYTISGYGMISDEKGEHRLSEGDGFLVNHDDASYVYWYPNDARVPWRVLWASFEGAGIRDMVAGMNREYGRVFSLPVTSPVIRSMRNFDPGTVRPIELSAADSARVAFDLIIALTQSVPSAADDASGLLVTRALSLINADTSRLYTATELAQALSVSREHLTRVFRERLKRSPHEHIVHQKMELAKVDLRLSGASLRVIAERYGFTSAAHFSSLFRGETGMTPREWRRR